MKKVLFVLPNLDGGGAQRTTILTANWLVDNSDLEVGIVLLDNRGDLRGLVSPRVQVSNIGPVKARGSIRKLRHFFQSHRPEVIIPAQNYLNVVVVLANWLNRKSSSRVLLWEKNIFPNHKMKVPLMVRAKLWISMNLTYQLAEGIVCNSPDTLESLKSAKIRLPRAVAVIPNMAAIEGKLKSSELKLSELHPNRFFLAVGRLTFQKGFDLLLKAFANMKASEIDLLILGEGELRQDLTDLARALGIEDRVFFLGFVENPRPYFENSAAFVLSSRWEGFGNVIVEALQSGAPVISFDCPGGPRWILGEGKFGELVPAGSPDYLSFALDNFLLSGSPVAKQERIARGLEFAPRKVGLDFLAQLESVSKDV